MLDRASHPSAHDCRATDNGRSQSETTETMSMRTLTIPSGHDDS